MLANQRDTYHDVQGEVHYDSLTPEDVAAHYRGDIQYSPEDDIHFPTLTVEETIRFAAKTRTPHARAGGESRDDYIEAITDALTTVFGLHDVRKTLVGDAGIRGISGGEKKRVSISEALACRSLINCWDGYAAPPRYCCHRVPDFHLQFNSRSRLLNRARVRPGSSGWHRYLQNDNCRDCLPSLRERV